MWHEHGNTSSKLGIDNNSTPLSCLVPSQGHIQTDKGILLCRSSGIQSLMEWCDMPSHKWYIWRNTSVIRLHLLLERTPWRWTSINSLAPGKLEWIFRYLILQIISVIGGWGISCELALGWMSLDLIDNKSTLVQVMTRCRQATNHYLGQCWPRSMSPYGVTSSMNFVTYLEFRAHVYTRINFLTGLAINIKSWNAPNIIHFVISHLRNILQLSRRNAEQATKCVPLWLTWINCNLIMDKYSHIQVSVGWNP